MTANAITPGTLRLSKGTWLFAPDGVDLLLRVVPRPEPSPEGFFSRPVQARLELRARAHRAGGTLAIEPRTGVPERVVGRVAVAGGASFVLDAGIAFVVHGVGAVAGDVVEVDVDTNAGVACVLL